MQRAFFARWNVNESDYRLQVKCWIIRVKSRINQIYGIFGC